MQNLKIKVLLKPNDMGGYYAQVLEHDLSADGRCFHSALMELSRVINVHVALAEQLGLKPFTCLDEAPCEYRQMWDGGVPVSAELPDLKLIKTPKLEAAFAVA